MRTSRTMRRQVILAVIIAILMVAVMVVLRKRQGPPPVPEGFVTTTLPQIGSPSNASLREKLILAWVWLWQSFPQNNVATYSFPATGTNSCSIHGLLNQCMEVSGWRYLIAKEVAAGSVQFGHTNVLSGPEWVAAFENALENGKPQWWNATNNTFIAENLVLIRRPESKTVFVVPKARAHEFQPSKAAP